MFYRSAYKTGMTKEDEGLLKRLRNRGFAVAVFAPSEVGDPLNRRPIEQGMVKAGRQTIKQIQETTDDAN